MRYAKQGITEAIKFLTWLHDTHQRTAATCLQQDVDEWLASGPTTRSKVRNFFAWARKARLNASVRITHQQPYLSAHSLRNSAWRGPRNFLAASPTHWPTALPESCCFSTPNP